MSDVAFAIAAPTPAEAPLAWVIFATPFALMLAALISAVVELRRARPLPMPASLRRVRAGVLILTRWTLILLTVGQALRWTTRWSETTLLIACVAVIALTEVLLVSQLRRIAEETWPNEPRHAGTRAGLGLPYE